MRMLPGPVLLPKIVFPDGSVMNDSTMLIERLEREYVGRSVLPHVDGLRFICSLLEDFADEFITKCMYHYRWVHDPDFAAYGIAMQQSIGPSIPDEVADKVARAIKERQVGRLKVVGSTAETGPIIEEFYLGFLAALEAHFASGHMFLLGSRPSAADFAVLGQIHPMIALDPETSRRTREAAPRVCAWYTYCVDLSGYAVIDEEAGWLTSVPPTLLRILEMVEVYYLPFLVANAKALENGAKEFEYTIKGNRPWKQPAFKYQGKCLQALQKQYAQVKADPWLVEQLKGIDLTALEPSSSRL